MKDMLWKLVTFVVVLSMIFAIFWGVKRQNWVTIPQMDNAMAPDYPPGTYHVGVTPSSVDEIQVGKPYAFYVPGGEGEVRVAWMIAKEGQRVEFKEENKEGRVYVNGVQSDCKILLSNKTSPPFVIPRGCVYLLSTAPKNDSLLFGPIPMRNVMGQL